METRELLLGLVGVPEVVTRVHNEVQVGRAMKNQIFHQAMPLGRRIYLLY
jgi:hypothetical protein